MRQTPIAEVHVLRVKEGAKRRGESPAGELGAYSGPTVNTPVNTLNGQERKMRDPLFPALNGLEAGPISLELEQVAAMHDVIEHWHGHNDIARPSHR